MNIILQHILVPGALFFLIIVTFCSDNLFFSLIANLHL